LEKLAVLVANGQRPNHPKIMQILKDAEEIICVDNGYEIVQKLNIIPSVLIGDLDSVNLDSVNQNVEVVKKENQNLSDLEKALHYCIEKNFTKIYLIGSTGLRDDHNLANLMLISDFIEKLDITVLSDEYEINAIKGKMKFSCKKGTQISLISIDANNQVTTNGLKYNLNNEALRSSSQGLSNLVTEDNFSIESEKPILLFRKLL